uniref:C-type lectin domain-containing protein n=1 Tax=Panagrolaimus sp. PS1159 TaxID=55785 RepID=A0AC35FJH2_9BILA
MVSKKIILLIAFFHFSLSQCPKGSFQWQTTCLFFNATEAGYANAELTCRNIGGHLASIHDAFTNAVLGQKASDYFQENAVSDFWIGAEKLYLNSNWSWTDESTFDFSDWGSGEPSNVGGDDCTAMSWVNGYWSAQNCFKLKPFACATIASISSSTLKTTISSTVVSTQVSSSTPTRPSTPTPSKPSTFSTGSPNAGNCNNGWTYFQGFCYGGFRQVDDDFKTSESYCQSLGGHLPSVHNNYVTPLFHSVWLGLHSDDNGITWKWTDNTPVDYLKWYINYPVMNQGYNCVLVDEYNDDYVPYFENINCNDNGTKWFHYSICKKQPSF